MRITVVGGGIAGLATALALAGAGREVTVIERARRFGEVGAGLSVWPNAVAALDALGVGDQVRRRSRRSRRPVIRDARGRLMSETHVTELERRFGPLLMIHRADLLDVLAGALPAAVRVRHGVTVAAVRADGTVADPSGTTSADLVVGADGIDSVLRAGLWPDSPPPRYLGYGAYRMVSDPLDVPDEGEAWGRGGRFGYAPLADGRVYCFAALTAPAGRPPQDLAGLRARFRAWHAPVPQLLDAVRPDALLHHDLYELPPLPSFARGRVVLVGDAAHAMAPDLGQGAGLALEDAATLGALIAEGPSAAGVPAALAEFDRVRRPRARAVATRARCIGAIAQWRWPPAAAGRDLLLRAAPDSAVLRALAPVLSWTPPHGG